MVPLYQHVISPLFNKFTPLPEGELRDQINALAKRVKDLTKKEKECTLTKKRKKKVSFPLTELYLMDGSKRSAHSNAYFFGFFKNKRIVIFDTLQEQVDVTGIEAIVAHELGHYSHSHTLKLMVVSLVHLFVFCFMFGLFVYNEDLYRSFGFDVQPLLVGLKLFSDVLSPIESVLSFLINFVTRAFEYQADQYATDLGYDLSLPLAKLMAENSSNMNPDSLYSAYHFSHPSLNERIAAINARKVQNERKSN